MLVKDTKWSQTFTGFLIIVLQNLVKKLSAHESNLTNLDFGNLDLLSITFKHQILFHGEKKNVNTMLRMSGIFY